MNNISNLLDRAKQSFSWTSFDPEKRGTQFIEEISDNLNSDIEQLQKYGATDEDLQRYCDKFYSIVSAISIPLGAIKALKLSKGTSISSLALTLLITLSRTWTG